MAKNTKEGALQTEALVHQTIIDIFMEHGWEAVTYGSIAKLTGLSRSGIQRIVPSKEAMGEAFQGQVFSYVFDKLDTSTPEAVVTSWLNAFDDPKFSNCIRYLVGAVHAEDMGKRKAAKGLEKMSSLLGRETTITLMGLSVVKLLDVDLVD
ncbi:TetR/AcrR family transcriptional regulator [Enterovibrio norvegicus]|uniref:TetR family transcriptional regulator n=1 Tax=Enterovibrio norvegicus TaxID=188144 RepID=A0A2N7LA76_9GAMM|nr:TetR/AcrR family transcriptional regulator [Enterovibrio norvegicus]PML80092.1 TetR family transcriptional regulator [Enterovibrio norvegicus]PMN65303.1 TetR family transcriptional regulator [Enterovibrio norvegicus]PMN91526.1 TetR family transcriptional regulator [Enterovibrio norvegicus]